MANLHSPRPEDVVSGGGTFSSCLVRAIRRPIPTLSSQTQTAATSVNGIEVQPGAPTSLVDAISRSTSSDAANQDANNNNSGYTETSSKPESVTRDNENDIKDETKEYLDKENWSRISRQGELVITSHLLPPAKLHTFILLTTSCRTKDKITR